MVVLEVVKVNQDIVKVTNAENVQALSKGVIHKGLASCGGIGKSKEDNKEFKQPITSSKGWFPFVTVLDPNQVVCRL